MAHRGERGHIGTHRNLPHKGVKEDKETYKGGPRYTGRTETHHSLGGMPGEHELDPPNRSLGMRGRTGHEEKRKLGTTRPDRRLGYTR